MYTIADLKLHALVCHPETPFQAIREINVAIAKTTTGDLSLTFSLVGDISSLSIPDSKLSQRADHLWQHTCVEMFAMAGEGPGYLEFNFSPSGEWAIYAFHAYRDRKELEIEANPRIVVRKKPNLLELEAKICRDFFQQGGPLKLGLSAVVEDLEGVFSYWSLWHPSGQPDFHHINSFTLKI